MRATFRSLPSWPYPPRPSRPSSFKVGFEDTLDDLEREIEHLGGSDVEIGIVIDPSQISMSGALRPAWHFKTRHHGAELSFVEAAGRQLSFHTDAYPSVQANLRAIALGLEALRAVDRYGITSTAEQYAGFQLSAGGPDPVRGRTLIAERFAGNTAAALRGTHPDTREPGYTDRDFADVQAARQMAAAK